MIGDKLTRAFYAVAGRDAEYILANTDICQRLEERARIEFDWFMMLPPRGMLPPVIYLPMSASPVSIFHELSHAYHIHHWPVVSHFCAVERCEEAASCLTWMAAYLGVLDYGRVQEHDQAISDPRQRATMVAGQRVANAWHNRTGEQRHVNAYIRNLLHADLR